MLFQTLERVIKTHSFDYWVSIWILRFDLWTGKISEPWIIFLDGYLSHDWWLNKKPIQLLKTLLANKKVVQPGKTCFFEWSFTWLFQSRFPKQILYLFNHSADFLSLILYLLNYFPLLYNVWFWNQKDKIIKWRCFFLHDNPFIIFLYFLWSKIAWISRCKDLNPQCSNLQPNRGRRGWEGDRHLTARTKT